MTHFVNRRTWQDLVPHLVNMTKSGADQIGGADLHVRSLAMSRDAARTGDLSSGLGSVDHHRRARRAREIKRGRSSGDAGSER
jgi:hypothetical protein